MKKIGIVIFVIISFLLCDNILAYDFYDRGDIVEYNGDIYYVISDEGSDSNYVTLLKYESLTVDDIYKYGKENNQLFVNKNIINFADPEEQVYRFPDNSGGIAYYTSETCRSEYEWNGSSFNSVDRIADNCINDYDSSDVKKVVDNWANDKFRPNDLVEVDGYKARILNDVDLIDNIGYELHCSSSCSLLKDNIEEWFDDILAVGHFWTMSIADDYSSSIFGLISGYIGDRYVDSINAVNPVINLNKCSINPKDTSCGGSGIIIDDPIQKVFNYGGKIKAYKKYSFGDKVTYNGEDYYVLIDSDVNKDYVALIKAKPLKTNVVAYYYQGEIKDINGYGAIPFSGLYENSEVKKIVDKWANDEFGDGLYEYNGYKARIPSIDDLIDYLFYDPLQYGHTTFSYKSGSDTPCWSTVDVESYWTMSNYEDSNYVWTIVNQDYQGCVARAFYGKYDYSSSAIRPIVYLKKCVIDSESAACSKCNIKDKETPLVKKYTIYNKTDIVFYKGDKYIVARDSDDFMPYVTLIRQKPFSASELNQYGVDKNGNSVINKYPYVNSNETSPVNTYKEIQINEPIDNENNWNAKIRYYVVTPGKAYEYTNGYGGMQFYSSEKCGYVNGSFYNSGCNKKYADSDIKIVIDNWVSDKGFINELFSINGNSSRLMNYDEQRLVKNTNYNGPIYYWIFNDDFFEGSYDIFYENNVYVDNDDYHWNLCYSSGFKYYLNSLYPNDVTTIMGVVYPVIHVNKQYLEDGAEIENYDLESCFEESDIDENIEVVETANTLKKMSWIFMICGLLLMFAGLYLYMSINRKLKQENKHKK